MNLLDRVHRLLADQQIGHALIGAAALAARGIARSTYDIDLLTVDGRVLQASAWGALVATGVVVEIRRGDQGDPLGGVVRLESPGERPVDVIVGKAAWQARAVQRAEALAEGPPVVLAVDLVLLKLYAGGAQDLWDVEQLLHLPSAEVLRAQVEAELVNLSEDIRSSWEAVTKRK